MHNIKIIPRIMIFRNNINASAVLIAMQSLKDYGHVHIKYQIQDFTGVGPPTTTIINHIAKVNVLAHYVNVLLP